MRNSHAFFKFSFIYYQVLFILGVARVEIPDWYIMLAFRLAALHSVINPWIYPLLRKRFRDSLVWHITTILHFLTCCLINAPSYSLSKYNRQSIIYFIDPFYSFWPLTLLVNASFNATFSLGHCVERFDNLVTCIKASLKTFTQYSEITYGKSKLVHQSSKIDLGISSIQFEYEKNCTFFIIIKYYFHGSYWVSGDFFSPNISIF